MNRDQSNLVVSAAASAPTASAAIAMYDDCYITRGRPYLAVYGCLTRQDPNHFHANADCLPTLSPALFLDADSVRAVSTRRF